jgi:hypothetical protein
LTIPPESATFEHIDIIRLGDEDGTDAILDQQ